LMLVSLLLSVGLSACGCPAGNGVVAARTVAGDLRWQSPDDTEVLDGHFLSSPSGDGISYDRATIPMSGASAPALPTDLVLFGMSSGCHAGAAGARTCDRNLRVRLTIHDVAPGPATYVLDDAHANLEVQVGAVVVPGNDPCPDKPDLMGCNSHPTPDPPFVPYTMVSGTLALSRLDQDCTDVLDACSLTADGSFMVSASSPEGALVELTSGTVSARDSFNHRDANTCN
jgi:hypothetical protein